jgi:hypothetical protein
LLSIVRRISPSIACRGGRGGRGRGAIAATVEERPDVSRFGELLSHQPTARWERAFTGLGRCWTRVMWQRLRGVVVAVRAPVVAGAQVAGLLSADGERQARLDDVARMPGGAD